MVAYEAPSKAAERLGISRNAVVNLVKSGQLEAIVINPQAKRVSYRISIESIEKYIKHNTVGAAPKPTKQNKVRGKWFRDGEVVNR